MQAQEHLARLPRVLRLVDGLLVGATVRTAAAAASDIAALMTDPAKARGVFAVQARDNLAAPFHDIVLLADSTRHTPSLRR